MGGTLLIPLPGETAAERRMYVPLAALVPVMVVYGYVACERIGRVVAKRRSRTWLRAGPSRLFAAVIFAFGPIFMVILSTGFLPPMGSMPLSSGFHHLS